MKIRRIITIVMLISTLVFIIAPISKATIDPNDYKPANPSTGDVSTIVNIANPIVGTLKVIGIVIAVITVAIIGVKYMTGSISEKAEYKKTMIPYLVGAILIFGASAITKVVVSLGSNIKT